MTEFVEKNNPALGDWSPCPYARAARVSNMIDTMFTTVSEFSSVVRESLDRLQSRDVVVVCFDHNDIDPVELQHWTSDMNRTLMPQDYVILEDHPSAPEYVNGIKMNFGHCGLLVIQRLSKLNSAADKLKSQGYYNTWDREAVDQVVSWRYET